jgi:hypothetical protein
VGRVPSSHKERQHQSWDEDAFHSLPVAQKQCEVSGKIEMERLNQVEIGEHKDGHKGKAKSRPRLTENGQQAGDKDGG